MTTAAGSLKPHGSVFPVDTCFDDGDDVAKAFPPQASSKRGVYNFKSISKMNKKDDLHTDIDDVFGDGDSRGEKRSVNEC